MQTLSTLQEKIAFALQMGGHAVPNAFEESVRLLGEGAWHEAYLVTLDQGGQLVIRFPKSVAYGSAVEFNETELHTEYEAAHQYYALANQARPGSCPEEHYYHVTPELTFTVETFAGAKLDFDAVDVATVYDLGHQMGELFRAMAEIAPGMSGYAFPEWDGEKLVGGAQGDLVEQWKEEREEFATELDELLASDLEFDRQTVAATMRSLLENRIAEREPVRLTNIDTSPENVVVLDGRIRTIDPRPLLFSMTNSVGNMLNNYQFHFPFHHNVQRYQHGEYDRHADKLFRMAEGVLDGYAGDDALLRQSARQEQFLQLFSLVMTHLRNRDAVLSQQAVIRMGDNDAIRARLPRLLRALEAFEMQ